MANRDRSQGFAFVYVDLAKLLRERDKISDDAEGPVYGPEEKSIRFARDTRPAPKAPETLAPQVADRNAAITQIRENLDRLQSLHHKLHAMLADLNQVADVKKKKS